MNRKILVTGATGKVGSAVVNSLHDHGKNVVAAINHPENAGSFKHRGIGAVVLDFNDSSTIKQALSGIGRVFLSMPLGPALGDWTRQFVEAARKAHITHVVRLSVLGAGRNSPLALGKAHGEADAVLADSGLRYTILRPNVFMQNYIAYYGGSIKQEHTFYLPHGEGKVSMIDTRDIASVVTSVLDDPAAHNGKTYELTGPRAISNTEAATAISEAVHETVGYVPVNDDIAHQQAIEMGMPSWLVRAVDELNREIRAGHFSRITPTVKDITGHLPHTFTDFAHDFSGAWK